MYPAAPLARKFLFVFFEVYFGTEDVIINSTFIFYKIMFILTEFKKISFQTCTLYFMDLLSKELQKIFCPHLILPIFQLAEVIASEVLECKSLSDLYHLRFVSFIYLKKKKKLNGVGHSLIFHQVVTGLFVTLSLFVTIHDLCVESL